MSTQTNPPDQAPRRTPPASILIQVGLTVVLLLVIFGVVIPQFSSYDDIWNAMQSIGLEEVVVLGGLFFVTEAMRACEPMLTVPGLGWRRAFVSNETATATSYVIPGPSGTAIRWHIFRTWAFTSEAFVRGTMVTSLWNDAVILIMPVVAVALLATQNNVPTNAIVISVIALVIALVGLVIVIAAVRSESFTRRLGTLLGRVMAWGRGMIKRPPVEQDFAEVAATFRLSIVDTVRRVWFWLTLEMIGRQAILCAMLLISLRAVGVPDAAITPAEALAVYAGVRIITFLGLTPGGIGISEALYISGLSLMTNGAYETQITAGVFVFRIFTYILPLPTGAVTYVIWRRKRSWWSDTVPVDDARHAAVVAVAADRQTMTD
ncbi:MAG TPA: lysylphosphatidylglycerol synthase transmembrane domain-containing protein [Gaiellales bacterium]|nr:lysylphosphatidylglycerol synthase transmembrane domain-containing protein [Gaiellales bacterium]